MSYSIAGSKIFDEPLVKVINNYKSRLSRCAGNPESIHLSIAIKFKMFYDQNYKLQFLITKIINNFSSDKVYILTLLGHQFWNIFIEVLKLKNGKDNKLCDEIKKINVELFQEDEITNAIIMLENAIKCYQAAGINLRQHQDYKDLPDALTLLQQQSSGMTISDSLSPETVDEMDVDPAEVQYETELAATLNQNNSQSFIPLIAKENLQQVAKHVRDSLFNSHLVEQYNRCGQSRRTYQPIIKQVIDSKDYRNPIYHVTIMIPVEFQVCFSDCFGQSEEMYNQFKLFLENIFKGSVCNTKNIQLNSYYYEYIYHLPFDDNETLQAFIKNVNNHFVQNEEILHSTRLKPGQPCI